MRRGAGNISEIVLCLFYFLTQKFGKNLNSKFFILKKEKNKNLMYKFALIYKITTLSARRKDWST